MEKTIRQIAREKAVIGIYQWLTVDASKEEIKEYVHADEALLEGRSAEQFCYWLIDTVIENKGSYEALLNTKLKKGWAFDRLNKMEQAILLVATCELLESELDKSIVINEAVINAKQYCDEDSYKFINGVLTAIE